MSCRTLCCLVLLVIAAVAAFPASSVVAAEAATAKSPSELLEKAVYTEETVGDLDAAVKLYERAVAEAEKVDAVAAKAQYRLGLCLLKQGKKEQGVAALKEFVRRFPQEKQLVAAAQKLLPIQPGLKLQPACWADGEALHYCIQLGGGLELGTIIFSAESAQRDGKKIWRFRSRTFANGRQMASRVDATFDTLQPIDSTWMISLAGEKICRYESGKAVVTSKIAGKETTQTIPLDKVVYDNEEGTFVFRGLPLADKYETKVPIFTSMGGTEIDIGFNVQGKESVEVPVGKFPCLKVLLAMPINQTFWFSADEHRYITKIEAGGVLMPLSEVETFKPGEAKNYKNSDLKVSLKLPPNWYAYRSKEASDKSFDRVYLLEPDGEFGVSIQGAKLGELSAEEKKSPRAWADKMLAEVAKQEKDFQVRADSWQPMTVSGQKDISCVADFATTDGQKRVGFAVCVFGQSRAAAITINGPRDDLERMKRMIAPVAESIEVQ
ncbi:MAG: DUF3108 domain-containing protein [Thermoguttaceae bacterium]